MDAIFLLKFHVDVRKIQHPQFVVSRRNRRFHASHTWIFLDNFSQELAEFNSEWVSVEETKLQ